MVLYTPTGDSTPNDVEAKIVPQRDVGLHHQTVSHQVCSVLGQHLFYTKSVYL